MKCDDDLTNNVCAGFSCVFEDLKRRVSITRNSRINASRRLRNRHEYFEKIIHFYSIMILVFSIWFLGNSIDEYGLLIAKVLLVLSLSLTFFTMFINIKNYKERALNFENNYQQLDILLNKIERRAVNKDEMDEGQLKGLYRESEKLLIDRENHHNIDFWTSSDKTKVKFKSEILYYNIKDKLILFLIAIYPIIILIIIYLVQLLFVQQPVNL